jgi:hypothetical protein
MGSAAAVGFFHYVKHGEKELLNVWRGLTKNPEKLCPFTHKKGEEILFCYSTHPSIKTITEFLEKYLELFSYLEIDSDVIEDLKEMIAEIKNPFSNQTVSMFKSNVLRMGKFMECYEKSFFRESKKFTCLESRRIGEALECFNNNCYQASSILMVSAIEGRLHTLIKSKNKKEYDSHIRDSPLGKILSLRDPNRYKSQKFDRIKKIIKSLIPSNHIPLIRLVNQYRVVSAHPKEEIITRNIAHSIITLSFAFLLDESLQIPLKLCNNKGQAPAL